MRRKRKVTVGSISECATMGAVMANGKKGGGLRRQSTTWGWEEDKGGIFGAVHLF